MINRAQNEPEAGNAEDENVQSRVLCKMCKAEYNVKRMNKRGLIN